MKSINGMLALMIPLTFVLPLRADTAHDLNEAGFWLEAKAQQLVRRSRVTMSDGTSGFEPAASGYYPAFWTRDYAYMIEGCPEAFTHTELKNACLTLVNAIGTYIGVPNTAVECIKPNGTVYHKPGWDTMGTYATADNSQFTVDIAWRTYQITKDTTLVNQTIDKLVATMNSVPRSSNGLVWINPDVAWDRCPYGFSDSVRKTGNELFCSLLDVRASRELADLLDVAGRGTEAATWRTAADTKVAAIRTTFWDPTYTPSNPGLFFAATVKCHQFDVWGSALAVQLGVATPDQATSVATYFKNNYSTMVLNGQIREIPTPLYWEYSVCGQGTNQNGGYWGTATGYYAAALKIVDPAKSQQTLLDMVNFYKARNAVPEFTDTGSVPGGASSYCTSATMPLAELKPYMASQQPTLKSMGGSLTAAKDVALQSNGGTAFAKDCITGFSEHTIPHLNDGVYGNSNSWIGNSQSNFAGVAFDQAYTIDSLAFGRDNGGEGTTYLDRYTGTYIFQYTKVANPNASTPDGDWTSFGAFYLDTLFPNTTNELRHVYEFDPIAGVTGVRILTCSDGSGFADYTCIDEIEVYASAVPEPGTLTLAIGCLVGLIGCVCRKRRRRA
jgi:hypothetical protein